MKRLAALVLAALLALSAAGCSRADGETVLRYDLVSAPDTLDPQYAATQAAQFVLTNTMEGLVMLSAEGGPQPGCAERWETSDDGLVWTFFLRSGLRWSNGDALTAGDFVFGLRRLFGQGAAQGTAKSFLAVQNAAEVLAGDRPESELGVSAQGDDRVVIRLTRAEPALPYLLAQPAALPCPERFFAEQRGRYGLSPNETLFNGPYLVEGWSSRALTLRENAYSHRGIQNAGVNFYLNRGDAVDLFLQGESDACLIPFHRLEQAEGVRGQTIADQSWVLLINAKNGAGGDASLRAALLGSLDAEDLRRRVGGGLPAAGGLVPPGVLLGETPYRALAGQTVPVAAVAAPRALLQEALERLGLGSLPRVTLLVGDFAPGPALGGAMQRQWQQALSVFVNMEQLSYPALLSRVSSGNYDLAVAPLTALGSSPADYLEGLSPDEEVAALLDLARRQSQAEAAAANLLAAEQRLIDSFVALPLFDAPSLFAQQAEIEGACYHSATETIYFANAKSSR